jgi:AcrR family transcriptional regulator
MSISYTSVGRTRQKSRTRDAILRAARELLARGENPTVEQAADEAQVSRATAYRYFPNQRDLLVATYPVIEATSLLGPEPPTEVTARLDRAVHELTRLVITYEPELRTMLRLSLEEKAGKLEQLILRRGRAIGWLEDALRPLRGRIPAPELRRLVYAVRCASGIEAMVWLRDIAGLSREDAVDLMRWSARNLLIAVLHGDRVRTRSSSRLGARRSGRTRGETGRVLRRTAR